jgi:DNA-binding PadR family transcriptional regulator
MQSGPLVRPTLPFLAKGGFRLLILRALRDKPMCGYEIMKSLEDRFQGFYRPSAGSVYPALRSLQIEGLVAVRGSERRKTYGLTANGKAFLRSQRAEMERQFRSFAAAVGPEKAALLHELRDTGRLLASNLRSLTPDQAQELREVVSELRERMASILSKSTEVEVRA